MLDTRCYAHIILYAFHLLFGAPSKGEAIVDCQVVLGSTQKDCVYLNRVYL